MQFHRCNVCGQVIAKVKDTGIDVYCCNEVMEKLVPKEKEEGLTEKHLPEHVVFDNKCAVFIGETPHPSTKDHFIEWIAIRTNKGNQRKCLKPGEAPKAIFNLDEDEVVVEIYSYCNLHSLWRTKVDPFKNTCGTCPTCGCNLDKGFRKK